MCLSTLSLEGVLANNKVESQLHWTNSAWLGSGYFQLGEDEVFHVSVPSVFTLHRSGKIRYQLYTALSVGLRGFKIATLSPPREFSTLSLAPGLQVVYQPNERWRLKPFVQGGAGWDFSSHAESVGLTSLGLKSVYQSSIFGQKTTFGQQVVFSNYIPFSPVEGSSTDQQGPLFTVLNTGVELKEFIAHRVGERFLDLNLYSIYTVFTPDLLRGVSHLSWMMSVGFNIGTQSTVPDHRSTLKMRGGLYYVFGDERLSGVRINLGFPF